MKTTLATQSNLVNESYTTRDLNSVLKTINFTHATRQKIYSLRDAAWVFFIGGWGLKQNHTGIQKNYDF